MVRNDQILTIFELFRHKNYVFLEEDHEFSFYSEKYDNL